MASTLGILFLPLAKLSENFLIISSCSERVLLLLLSINNFSGLMATSERLEAKASKSGYCLCQSVQNFLPESFKDLID